MVEDIRQASLLAPSLLEPGTPPETPGMRRVNWTKSRPFSREFLDLRLIDRGAEFGTVGLDQARNGAQFVDANVCDADSTVPCGLA